MQTTEAPKIETAARYVTVSCKLCGAHVRAIEWAVARGTARCERCEQGTLSAARIIEPDRSPQPGADPLASW